MNQKSASVEFLTKERVVNPACLRREYQIKAVRAPWSRVPLAFAC
jgi:hypothetical protein